MSRASLAISFLLLFALTSSATAPTPGNASLKGTYVFQLTGPHEESWGATLTCNGQPVFMGGSQTRDQAVAGTMTFNGTGGLTGSFTQYGKLNQAASNATVSCNSGGNAVYNAPSSGTITGTYSIQSSGKGTMNLTVTPSDGPVEPINLTLAGGCNSQGIYNTVLLMNLKPDNSVSSQGLARLQ